MFDTGQPFTVAMACGAGLTPRQLQSSRFRRLFSGVYVDSEVEVTTELLARAVGLVLPVGAVVGGATAALLHGADVRRQGEDRIAVVTAREDQVRRRGVVSRAALVEEGDVVEVFGIRCLSPVRVAFDFARCCRVVDGLVGVDAMLNRGGCRLEDLVGYAEARPGWRGVRFARDLLRHAEPLSESVMETRLRLALVRDGLPRPTAQVDLYDPSGAHVARLDLGYPEWKVGIDYDGEVHRDRWRYDLERQEGVRDLGWWHRRYTSIHAADGWRQVVGQVRDALAAAGWRPRSPSESPQLPRDLALFNGRSGSNTLKSARSRLKAG